MLLVVLRLFWTNTPRSRQQNHAQVWMGDGWIWRRNVKAVVGRKGGVGEPAACFALPKEILQGRHT